MSADIAKLAGRTEGQILREDDDGWDVARLGFNLAADQRPAAVAIPKSSTDVTAIVGFAAENGLRVAAQGPGHGAPALGDLGGAILLRTHELSAIEVDPAARRATVGAGAAWGPVVAACAEHGLVPLAGSSPTVGVGGYSLGGGIGFLARKHGIQANRVTGIDVVLADGREVRADAGSEADLFWALRGGGGSFGVVTALEFELIELADFTGGALAWPWERASEVVPAWLEWTRSASDEVCTGIRLMQFPPLDVVPEPLRGRQLVMIDAVHCGSAEDADAALAPLRALEPELDMVARHPGVAISAVHGDPTDPVPAVSSHMLLTDLSDEGAAKWVEVAGPGSGSPLMFSEIRHWGGAIAQQPEGAGAIGSFSESFAVFNIAMAMGPELVAAAAAHGEKIAGALAEWRSDRVYSSFEEVPSSAESGFPAASYSRLREVKAAVDPGDLFQSNHPVEPA